MWHNLENPREDYGKSRHADIPFDLCSEQPWPIESGSLDIVYSSHTIEHLNDKFVMALLEQAARCLKPTGLIRLTTPNIDLYSDAYRRRDHEFFGRASGHGTYSLEQQFLYCFAGPLSILGQDSGLPKIGDAEFAVLFKSGKALDLIDQIPDDMVRKFPKHHKTWFASEKLCGMLIDTGFDAHQSAYGQSRSPILRDTSFFDHTHPGLSLYVEATRR